MRTIHRTGAMEHAGRYDRLAGWLLRRFYRRVAADVAAAGLPDGARVLDVGTGPGRLPLLVAARCGQLRVDAVDLSEPMVQRARSRAAAAGLADRIDVAVADVAALAYPDGVFDLVVSTLSQHHWADAEAALRELRRVLRPGGQIWIYDFRSVLGRAEAAARAAFAGHPAHTVRRETVRTGRLPLTLVGRLRVQSG